MFPVLLALCALPLALADRHARSLAGLLAPSLAAPAYAAAHSGTGCECTLAVQVYNDCQNCGENCGICLSPCRNESVWDALAGCHACFWNAEAWPDSERQADTYFSDVARFCLRHDVGSGHHLLQASQQQVFAGMWSTVIDETASEPSSSSLLSRDLSSNAAGVVAAPMFALVAITTALFV